MKNLGKLAIVFTAIWLALFIVGGIFVGCGAVSEFSNGNLKDSVSELLNEVSTVSSNMNINNVNGAAYSTAVSDTVKEIEFRSFACKMVFHTSNSDKIRIEYSGKNISGGEVPVSFVFTDDKITVSAKTFSENDINIVPFSVSSVSEKNFKCDIYLPDSFCGTLSLLNSAGEMTFKSLTLETLVVSGAGRVKISDCTLGKLVCERAAAELDARGAISSVEISDNIGKLDIESTVPFTNPSSIETSVGEVDIELPVGSKLKVTTTNSLGEIEIDSALKSESGVEFTINNALGEVDISIAD